LVHPTSPVMLTTIGPQRAFLFIFRKEKLIFF